MTTRTRTLVLVQYGKSRRVADLDPKDFEALCKPMVKKNWRLTTIGNVVQRVRVVLKFAYDSGGHGRISHGAPTVPNC